MLRPFVDEDTALIQEVASDPLIPLITTVPPEPSEVAARAFILVAGTVVGPMSSVCSRGLPDMSDSTRTPTTLSNIGVAMFAVADQDAALAFYTDKLGFEVRGDTRFGEHDEMRWLEVAPPGSRARLALNPPMGGEPGGGSIGVETADVLGEHARLSAIGGIDLDPEPMRTPGAPLMFMLRDPDGNHIVVVEEPPAA